MTHRTGYNDFIQNLLVDFIYSGCAALALAVAYIVSGSWFCYFLSLLPFLYRLSNTDKAGAALTGGLFAVSLIFVFYLPGLFNRFIELTVVILSLCGGLTAFSVIINKFKKYFLLSLILSAGLCIPLEFLLKAVLESGLVITRELNIVGFACRAAALIGFLFVSLLIISINSLLLVIIDILFRLTFAVNINRPARKRILCGGSRIIALLKHEGCLPGLRAPPLRS